MLLQEFDKYLLFAIRCLRCYLSFFCKLVLLLYPYRVSAERRNIGDNSNFFLNLQNKIIKQNVFREC